MVGAFKVGWCSREFFGHVYRRKRTPQRQLPRDAGGAHAIGGWDFLVSKQSWGHLSSNRY